VLEAASGYTIGKLLLGIRRVDGQGRRPAIRLRWGDDTRVVRAAREANKT